MKTKSCFFIGHREADEEVFPALESEVRRHIVELGVTEFIVGHYGGFDYLSRKAVLAAKREYPELCLRLLLPYHPGERPVKTPEGVDCTYFLGLVVQVWQPGFAPQGGFLSGQKATKDPPKGVPFGIPVVYLFSRFGPKSALGLVGRIG